MRRFSSKAKQIHQVHYHLARVVEKQSNLGNSLLLASNKTKERAEHTTESEKSTSKSNARFGMGLESNDGVNPRERDELEGLATKEFDGVLGENDFIWYIRLLREVRLVCSFLERVLNIEGFRSKGLGVIRRASDIYVVKEDVLGHSPKLNTNTTLFT